MCEQFLNSSQRYQHFSEKICLFQMLTLNSLVYAGKQNLLQSLSISHTRLKTELQNLHLIEISYLLVIFLIMCRAFTPYKYLHRHGHCPLNFRFSWIMAYKVENGRMFNWIQQHHSNCSCFAYRQHVVKSVENVVSCIPQLEFEQNNVITVNQFHRPVNSWYLYP